MANLMDENGFKRVWSNLKTKLAEKANSSHTHTISQITNLQSTLDERYLNVTNAKTYSPSNLAKVQIPSMEIGQMQYVSVTTSITSGSSTSSLYQRRITLPTGGKYYLIIESSRGNNSTITKGITNGGTYVDNKITNDEDDLYGQYSGSVQLVGTIIRIS